MTRGESLSVQDAWQEVVIRLPGSCFVLVFTPLNRGRLVPVKPTQIVGQSVRRVDGWDKVTGKARYIEDYATAEAVYVATFRSPRPHLRILGLDDRAALRLPGVLRVITCDDIPGHNRVPLVFQDHPFLAEKVARFTGEAIALVVAETPEAARQGVAALHLDYEERPAVLDPLQAMDPDSPLLYEEDYGHNIFKKFTVRRGDTEKAFAECEVVVQREFRTGYQDHGYLETQGMIAEPTPEGGILLHGSMQCPFYVLDALGQLLDLPHNRIQVVQRTVGGAFGGKEDVPSIVGGHAALAAWLTGRPARLIYSREEDFIAMSKRHPSFSRVKYGAMRDGTLVACEVFYLLDGGAYSTLSPVVLFRGTAHAQGPYRIPHVTVDSLAVATHTVPSGAFRGFGQPQICFAQERLIDELAERLRMDPATLRQKNALRTGDTTASGQLVDEYCALDEVISAVLERSHWEERRAAYEAQPAEGTWEDIRLVRRGIGMSANYYGVSLGAGGNFMDRAAAHVQINRDGSVLAAVGNTEIGQGARTVLGQILAEALGAPVEAVRLVESDTTRVPDSGPTVASRTTLMSGNALLDAARPLRTQLEEVAAEVLQCPLQKLSVRPDRFRSPQGASLSFGEVAHECWGRRLQMSQQGWFAAPTTTYDEKGQGDVYFTYVYSANVAEVEVDMETGQVKLLALYSAHDMGQPINPQLAEGQIEGGALQGVGYALLEHLYSEDGDILNGHFTGYILPTIADTPERLVPIILGKPYEGGPFGAKGMAESPLIGPAPAVINAVVQAIGQPLYQIPALPERIQAVLVGDRYGE